jgi:hypothetical protein
MLNNSLPQAMFTASNPVFEFDTRKLGWFQRFQRSKSLTWYGVRWLLVFYIVLLVGMLIAQPWDAGPGTRRVRVPGFFDVNTYASLSTGLYVGAAVLFVLGSITLINSEMNSGNWDLLMLTNMDRQSILDAKFAAAQVRAWRIMMISRAAQTGLVLFNFFRTFGYVITYNFNYPPGGFYYRIPPLVFWVTSILSLVFAWYIPLWQMRAITAASIASSGRVRNVIFASVAAFGIVLMVQLVLNVIGSIPRTIQFELAVLSRNNAVYSSGYGGTGTLNSQNGSTTNSTPRNNYNGNNTGGNYNGGYIIRYGPPIDPIVFSLLSSLFVVGGTFVLYWFVKTASLRYAGATAFRPD